MKTERAPEAQGRMRKEELKAADAAMFDVRGLMFDVQHKRKRLENVTWI